MPGRNIKSKAMERIPLRKVDHRARSFRRGSTSCLEWLIDPIAASVFFKEYWARRPLLLQRANLDYFRSILTLTEIDRVITTLSLTFPDLCLTNAVREIMRDSYVLNDNTVDPDALYREFADGSTIILSQLHTKVPSLAHLCRELEAELSSPFQTNVYLTPGHAQGFKSHYDTHDVLVLQITGSKHWRLYGIPVELPLWGQDFDAKLHQTGPISMEFDLAAGDTLYVPRGVVHDAVSTAETSLHITVGILAYTWADLLLESLAAVILDKPAFRHPLPVGFARAQFDRAQAHRLFADLISQFASSADCDRALDCFVEEFVRTRRPELIGQMEQLQQLIQLDLDCNVAMRPRVLHKIIQDGNDVQLLCFRKAIKFPRNAEPALLFALSKRKFRVGELPGLDAESQVVLAKRLIREGLLKQV